MRTAATNCAAMQAGDPVEWFTEIPVVSRTYLALSFLTTAACALDLVSPFALYFNYKLIFQNGEVWRLFTNFLFFGTFGLDFLFHMYFLVRYSRLLEENSFRGRTADFIWMLVFGATLMTACAPFVSIHFLGSSLTFMMVYLWGRRNRYERLSFLGMFPFTAPYLPWVLLSFSYLLGHSVIVDVIGIVAGHLYYYLEDVWPAMADARGWKRRQLLKTPFVVTKLVEMFQGRGGNVHLDNDDLYAGVGDDADALRDAGLEGFDVADGGDGADVRVGGGGGDGDDEPADPPADAAQQ